jgi:hypothetical protein
VKKVKQIVKQKTKESIQSNTESRILRSKYGTPGATRTPDTRFRKPLLYPLSYRGKLPQAIIAEYGNSQQPLSQNCQTASMA